MTKAQIARQYRRWGYTYEDIATVMGISRAWAWLLCDDTRLAKHQARANARLLGAGVCPDCGGPMTKPEHGVYVTGHAHERCAKCHAAKESERAFAFRVRGETLRCPACKERKPFADYPARPLARYLSREVNAGNPPACRPCSSAARRDYRNRHKEPCRECGTPREWGGKGPDSGLCLRCFRARKRAVA